VDILITTLPLLSVLEDVPRLEQAAVGQGEVYEQEVSEDRSSHSLGQQIEVGVVAVELAIPVLLPSVEEVVGHLVLEDRVNRLLLVYLRKSPEELGQLLRLFEGALLHEQLGLG